MSAKDTIFEVHGSVFLMKDFAEYLYLLGYKKLELFETSVHSRIRLNTEKKLFENVHRVNSFYEYLLYHVDKDAEEIDNLLTGPNDNLTEARDEFFKAIEDIEVNEPEDLSQTNRCSKGKLYGSGKGWYPSLTNGGLVFKNNTTLGNSSLTPDDNSENNNWTLDCDMGVKHNQGKLPIDTVLTKQFPNAVEALVKCSMYGHEKYNENGEDEDWSNFRRVEGGSQTYADAAARHNQNKSEKDEESGLPHIYHKLWNVMAEVELWFEETKKEVL